MCESCIYRKNGIEITIKDYKNTLDEDDEERRILEQLKAERERKALKKANAEIQTLRQQKEAEFNKEDEALARAEAEIKLKREENRSKREALHRGEYDGELTASIVQQASQIQITNVSVPRATPRERTLITRPPLQGLIKSKSMFRFTHKSKVYTCCSENGANFTDQDDGTVHKSLASWTVAVIERSGGGGRKVSAYEVCEVFLKASNEWKKWGLVYKEDTTRIN